MLVVEYKINKSSRNELREGFSFGIRVKSGWTVESQLSPYFEAWMATSQHIVLKPRKSQTAQGKKSQHKWQALGMYCQRKGQETPLYKVKWEWGFGASTLREKACNLVLKKRTQMHMGSSPKQSWEVDVHIRCFWTLWPLSCYQWNFHVSLIWCKICTIK